MPLPDYVRTNFVNDGPPALSADVLNNAENAIDALVNEINVATAALAVAQAKLAGIQEFATANETDVYLLDRGNHSGVQPTNTINGLDAVLAAKHSDIANTKMIHAFIYSNVNDARPTASTAVIIWWFAATAGLDLPNNALDFDRADLLGA